MKYCVHCGKELLDEAVICVGCGCSVENKKEQITDEIILENIEKNSKNNIIFPAISLGLVVISVILYLFAHVYIGIATLCLAVALTFIISVKIKRSFDDAGVEKTRARSIELELRKRSKAVKLNFVAIIVSCVILIMFGVGLGVIDSQKSSIPSKYKDMYKGSYGKGFVYQMEEISDVLYYANSKYAKLYD